MVEFQRTRARARSHPATACRRGNVVPRELRARLAPAEGDVILLVDALRPERPRRLACRASAWDQGCETWRRHRDASELARASVAVGRIICNGCGFSSFAGPRLQHAARGRHNQAGGGRGRAAVRGRHDAPAGTAGHVAACVVVGHAADQSRRCSAICMQAARRRPNSWTRRAWRWWPWI
jgi:hypothetical protein